MAYEFDDLFLVPRHGFDIPAIASALWRPCGFSRFGAQLLLPRPLRGGFSVGTNLLASSLHQAQNR
mgnify:CR=1 FL=1